MDEYFGSHVLRGSYEAKGLIRVLIHLLACAHIHQLQVSIPAHHNILRLQVPVNQRLLAEQLQDVDQQSNIKSSLFEGKNANGSDNIEQVPSFDILSEEVDVVVVFKRPVVLYNKGAVLKANQTQSFLLLLT